MIQRVVFISVLGIILIGCKSRKTAVVAKKPRLQVIQQNSTNKTTNEVEILDDGTYVMPEDTGEFIRFDIDSPEDYVDTFSDIAQFEMKAYGIPASITLAQGLLESGLGKGELALKTNNHFGIKCHTGWQGDFDHHDDDEKGECFRKYNHPMYSYRDHSIFLSGRGRYAFLFELRNDDYKGWARGLRKAGYATDRQYPQKLISLIERYRLHQFDTAVTDAGYGNASYGPENREYKNRSGESMGSENQQSERSNSEAVANAKTQFDTHVVQSGDTLYSISRRYSVSVNDLKRWNYMYDDKLAVGQEITVKSASFN
ncbi:MAG: glucosaminidase domain-containing protein [Pricia sp.]